MRTTGCPATTGRPLPEVRALTIRQPWADAITHSTKRTENRTRPTSCRGLVLLHAGLQTDPTALLPERATTRPGVRGAVIGTARITDCHRATDGCCAPWGFPDAWHWQLADVHALADPVPCRGALGLWRPGDAVLTAVLAQLPVEAR
ncbi:hypothetical protein GCM10010406_52270 [Streptomyces thermolineatus]|uniref:ASCH domain-containing protein n=1 Tax=Streptomyces thermolineatus TaxID=44033 RepID=A0ABP6A935_9ACTN